MERVRRGNPEAHIVLQICHWAKLRGYYIGKIKNKGSRIGKRFIFDPYQWRGLPDLCLFAGKKMYFIEVKSKTGTQSKEQIFFQSLCETAGVPYLLVRSLDEVLEKTGEIP